MEHEEEIKLWQPILSGLLLITGLVMAWNPVTWFQNPYIQLAWYIVAFLPVGLNVIHEAWEYAQKGDYFSEFMLMSVACIGAFCIGEYPEAVAVMWLYCIGEMLQDRAVDKARDNISSLMAFRPDRVRVLKPEKQEVLQTSVTEFSDSEKTTIEAQTAYFSTSGNTVFMAPETVEIGDIIEVLPGERVPLDGRLLSETEFNGHEEAISTDFSMVKQQQNSTFSTFNTAALTGESMPRTIVPGEEVLAGMIVLEQAVRIQVTRKSKDSAISRILNMVEEAAERKAPTELFVRKFAHIYTPIVVVLAVFTVLLPYLYTFIAPDFHYQFSTWLNRALVFLVISCPCALVISVPLSYFAGIGTASKQGILFKGGNYLDAITNVDTVVFDKTGTLTTGEFTVQQISGIDKTDLQTIVAMERNSNHPIAQAILKGHEDKGKINAKDIPGYGLAAEIEGQIWLVGTLRLLEKEGITYPDELKNIPETIVACAKNNRFIGYILLADTVKVDAKQTIDRLRNMGVRHIEMLSGDKQALVQKVATQVGIDQATGNLLPEDKARRIEELKFIGKKVAFVGDGINDAPVLALSDVGVAMGAMGADMAIETADIVLQTDHPSRLPQAITIGRRTRNIVLQNIAFAIGIKVLFMVLGLWGIANLWEAVFADSGVALLAVLNALRIRKA